MSIYVPDPVDIQLEEPHEEEINPLKITAGDIINMSLNEYADRREELLTWAREQGNRRRPAFLWPRDLNVTRIGGVT